MKNNTTKTDKLKEITDYIVHELEHIHEEDYQLPWNRNGVRALDPMNPLTGTHYSGFNWLILACCAGFNVQKKDKKTFSSARFATYRQWAEHGCQVRAGASGIPLIFFKTIEEEKEEDSKQRKVINRFTVFGAEDVEGAEAYLADTAMPKAGTCDIEALCAQLGVTLKHGGSKAVCARLVDDPLTRWIQMPLKENFVNEERYLSTVLHELIHWTAPVVVRRAWLEENFSNADERYAFEELVAEIGATMLCGKFQITNQPQVESMQYIKEWLKHLHNDQAYLFRAAAKAQQAVSWILKNGHVVTEELEADDQQAVQHV